MKKLLLMISLGLGAVSAILFHIADRTSQPPTQVATTELAVPAPLNSEPAPATDLPEPPPPAAIPQLQASTQQQPDPSATVPPLPEAWQNLPDAKHASEEQAWLDEQKKWEEDVRQAELQAKQQAEATHNEQYQAAQEQLRQASLQPPSDRQREHQEQAR